MKWIIEVAFLVILAISTTAYRHVNKDAVIEEKEEMAELMKELEDETAVMQTAHSLICSSSNPLAGIKWAIKGTTANVRDFLTPHIDTKFTSDIKCANGITLKQILKMANSMVPRSKKPFKISGGSSYAYLPSLHGCTGKFYASCSDGTCNQRHITTNRNYKDSEMYIIRDCNNVQEYWSAWTPCYFCEKSLQMWKKSQKNRVTIHIGKQYIGENKGTNINCLALMHLDGFDFVPWDWSTFVQQVQPTAECARVLDLIQLCKEFQDQERVMKTYVANIQRLAQPSNRKKLKAACNRGPGRRQ